MSYLFKKLDVPSIQLNSRGLYALKPIYSQTQNEKKKKNKMVNAKNKSPKLQYQLQSDELN